MWTRPTQRIAQRCQLGFVSVVSLSKVSSDAQTNLQALVCKRRRRREIERERENKKINSDRESEKKETARERYRERVRGGITLVSARSQKKVCVYIYIYNDLRAVSSGGHLCSSEPKWYRFAKGVGGSGLATDRAKTTPKIVPRVMSPGLKGREGRKGEENGSDTLA